MRAAINVAPADPNDPSQLVIACGKNNDGLTFPTFAVRLDPNTMTYDIDDTFDLEDWRQSLRESSSARKAPKAIPAHVVSILRKHGGRMPKSEVNDQLMKSRRCGRSTAYGVIREAIEEGQVVEESGDLLLRNPVVPSS